MSRGTILIFARYTVAGPPHEFAISSSHSNAAEPPSRPSSFYGEFATKIRKNFEFSLRRTRQNAHDADGGGGGDAQKKQKNRKKNKNRLKRAKRILNPFNDTPPFAQPSNGNPPLHEYIAPPSDIS